MAESQHPDSGCVLLTDDEDALRRALGRQLRNKGHVVVEASTGKQAITMLDEVAVDVIVCDINMPEMDGMTLLRLVRERDQDLPVVLLTGSPDVSTAVKAVGYGAFEYLTKPDDLHRLPDCVARAIAQRRASTTRRQLLESAQASSQRRIRQTSGPIGAGTIVADRYRVGRELGFGGMGTVYEAHRMDLADMPVALKVLHARLASRSDQLRRFRREAEVVAKINHANIVKILDFVSEEEGPHCLVMELLDGETLAMAIAHDPPFSDQRVAFIAVQVLAALSAAHGVNVLHRDLKPENVFLTNIAGMSDVVKLLDFGVAKLLADDRDSKLTETGIILGTPAYMAPEYARGEPPGTTGDLYALGCVMYEALTRKQPFAAANYNALLFAIQEKKPQPLVELRPDISPELAAVVERAMSKEASERFSSANEMADALKPWCVWEPPRDSSRNALGTAPTEESRPLRSRS
jgi:serine/threonine-protein kinase